MTIQKLILFDIDGTLLHSHGATREAKQMSMRDVFGLDAGVMNHPFGGKTDWQILNELLVPQGFDPIEIGKKMPHYERVFSMHLRNIIDNFLVEPLPNALALVQHLHERPDVMVGLVTGNTASTAFLKLEAGGFDTKMFVVGAYGSESDDRNRLPGIALQRAAKKAGYDIAPADTIIIGDTPADVACARAVGAVAVTVFTGFANRQAVLAANADYQLEDLTTFLDVVPL